MNINNVSSFTINVSESNYILCEVRNASTLAPYFPLRPERVGRTDITYSRVTRLTRVTRVTRVTRLTRVTRVPFRSSDTYTVGSSSGDGASTSARSGDASTERSLRSKSEDSLMQRLSRMLAPAGVGGVGGDDSGAWPSTSSQRVRAYLERVRTDPARASTDCGVGGTEGLSAAGLRRYTSNGRRDRMIYECLNGITGRNCMPRIGKSGRPRARR